MEEGEGLLRACIVACRTVARACQELANLSKN